ncbi:MAG: HAMP domain-containing sensor histidine kinase, partial [Aestuariivirga sp.]
MVDKLASRAASRKLLWIILSLILPVFALAYMLFEAWSDDIVFSQKELQGLEMSLHILPVLVKKAMPHAASVENPHSIDEELAMDHGHDFDPAVLKQIKSIGKLDREKQMDAVRELIAQIGKDSNLLLDPEAEPLFLILPMFLDLPEIAVDYHNFHEKIDDAWKDYSISAREYTDVVLLIGNLSELVEKSERAINLAKESAAGKSTYAGLQESVQAISARINTYKELVAESTFTRPTFALHTFTAANKANDKFLDNVEKTWLSAAGKVHDLVQQRVDRLIRRAYILGAFGLLSCVVGLGIAVTMFRTTLKKLDEVAASRDAANSARLEAEAMTDRMTEINEEAAQLNSTLSNNMRKLKEAQDELVKKGRMEQLGQLTATVAHELRNPLSTVQNTAFLLDRKFSGKGLGMEVQIKRINNGVSRCNEIITQLLDFSRAGKIHTELADFDEWLLKVVEEQAALLPQAVNFSCELGLAPLQVPFDGSRLQRAVINLMSNASEAMVGNGKKPGDFAVSNPVMTISTRRKGDFVELTIADNGPGIAPEHLQKIREPLFTTKNFGTGLGIPAVEQIVVQHGGVLDIASTPGKG